MKETQNKKSNMMRNVIISLLLITGLLATVDYYKTHILLGKTDTTIETPADTTINK